MRYYSPDEIASILKVKPKEIYEFIAFNKLLPVKLGANYRISQEELNDFKKAYYRN